MISLLIYSNGNYNNTDKAQNIISKDQILQYINKQVPCDSTSRSMYQTHVKNRTDQINKIVTCLKNNNYQKCFFFGKYRLCLRVYFYNLYLS